MLLVTAQLTSRLDDAPPCVQTPQCCDSGFYTLDECGCCLTCAKPEGAVCGGPFRIAGQCAAGLRCLRQCGQSSNLLLPTNLRDVSHCPKKAPAFSLLKGPACTFKIKTMLTKPPIPYDPCIGIPISHLITVFRHPFSNLF